MTQACVSRFSRREDVAFGSTRRDIWNSAFSRPLPSVVRNSVLNRWLDKAPTIDAKLTFAGLRTPAATAKNHKPLIVQRPLLLPAALDHQRPAVLDRCAALRVTADLYGRAGCDGKRTLLDPIDICSASRLDDKAALMPAEQPEAAALHDDPTNMLMNDMVGGEDCRLDPPTIHELERLAPLVHVRQRMLTIDCESLERSPEALAEALLLRLGLLQGYREATPTQWRDIRARLDLEPTIVVLDSFERWEQSLPPAFLALHGWPTRIVITSRVREQRGASTPDGTIVLDRLSREEARKLLWRGKKRPSSAPKIEAAANGIALACVWLRRVSTSKHRGGARLEEIFDACCADLTAHELDVLRVVCSVPASLSLAHLTDILEKDSGAAVRVLHARDLLAYSGDGETDVRPAHPLVRQFIVRATAASWRPRVDDALARWARRRVKADGRDMNWTGLARLGADWENIRAVIEALLGGAATRVELGLELWRDVDYFLWSGGRLREREQFGRRVLAVARSKKHLRYRVHALVDALAETLWHRDLNRNVMECERCLNEAAKLCETDSTLVRERLHVQYYRARFLRQRGLVDEALKLAKRTEREAKAEGALDIQAQCLNQIGHLLRSRRDYDAAHRAYDQAGALFEKRGDREMVAVVNRQRGRCFLTEERHREVIVALENSMGVFDELGLAVERAEAGIHHAEALAAAGDVEDARQEFSNLEGYFSSIGHRTRLDELHESRRRALDT